VLAELLKVFKQHRDENNVIIMTINWELYHITIKKMFKNLNYCWDIADQ